MYCYIRFNAGVETCALESICKFYISVSFRRHSFPHVSFDFASFVDAPRAGRAPCRFLPISHFRQLSEQRDVQWAKNALAEEKRRLVISAATLAAAAALETCVFHWFPLFFFCSTATRSARYVSDLSVWIIVPPSTERTQRTLIYSDGAKWSAKKFNAEYLKANDQNFRTR